VVSDSPTSSQPAASILPQLADTAELVAHARSIAGLKVAVLVPNYRGAEAAIAAGAHKITIPLSVSETHSLKNVRRTHAQMYEEVARIAALIRSLPAAQRPHFEGGLSTAFGCTLEGRITHAQVLKAAEALLAAGCDEVGLSDTTGYADPRNVRELTQSLWSACGRDRLTGIHLHNTRGQGLACALAAVEIGLKTVDASLGGIGGCPFAPGASGNIVTEDLVFMLEAMGLKTGINLEQLLAVREIVRAALPDEVELYGFTAATGLPKGFRAASAPA
jgi:hydroxymethylglutaryl-CoA lyase